MSIARSARAQFKELLDLTATVAMTAVAITFLWLLYKDNGPVRRAGPHENDLPKQPMSLEGAPLLGSPTAEFTIVEFSDFECPFCSEFSTTVLPSVRKSLIDSGRVNLSFRHLPLSKHARAAAAASAAACAAEQGRFWEFHDLAFARPGASATMSCAITPTIRDSISRPSPAAVRATGQVVP